MTTRTRPVPDDIVDVPVLDLNAGANEKMRYFLIGPRADDRVSAAGYKLVVVLPGGKGGADFNPFVCRIFKNALPAGCSVAQPVAFKWTADQQIVWPTRMSKVPGQQFATEDSVEAVIKDVRAEHKLDDRHIYTLSWSSGGPAAYAVSLAENSPVTGSFGAMSVFKPDQLPSLDRAKGRAYYLYHSPNDRVCPYRMAAEAEISDSRKRDWRPSTDGPAGSSLGDPPARPMRPHRPHLPCAAAARLPGHSQ